MAVSRETVQATVARFGVPNPAATATAVAALIDALAVEPDPPTTIRDPAEALDRHIADSLAGLAVEQLRSAQRIADLGAGAGFPGLALAAALSDASVDLIESSRRKCEVIQRLAAAAGLANRARALPVRAEDHARGQGGAAYDLATARALAPLPVICEYAAPLLRTGGALVAWKGAPEAAEARAGDAAAARLGLSGAQVVPTAPFERSKERHLYVYSKISDTPPEFPRRSGIARKRPVA